MATYVCNKLASDQVHYSVAKVARTLGLGRQNVLSVPTDRQFRLLPSALIARIMTAGGSV
jgi:glutamate/tyrosine decarboxylase-like PLP-dependent enzyme